MKFFLFGRKFLNQKISGFSAALGVSAMLAILAGCGSGSTANAPATPSANTSGITLTLSASSATVKTDNSDSTTITVTALKAGAPVTSLVVTLTTDTGALSTSSVTTDTAGTATFTFSTGTTAVTSKTNRTATIIASATGGATAQIPIQITGSTVTVSATGATLPSDGTGAVTMTVTAKDAGGTVIASAPVTVANDPAFAGVVAFTPATATGTTNTSGQATFTVAGTAATGAAQVQATALGATGTLTFTVNAVAATFSIDQVALNGTVTGGANPSAVSMTLTGSLEVRASAPGTAPVGQNVTFATTLGTWSNGLTSITVPVGTGCTATGNVAGKACAILTTTLAGVSNVQAYDPQLTTNTDNLTVSMTAVTATRITLQPSPAVVAQSVGSTTGSSTLIATVTDASNRPVGGAPVAFSIVNPTGGGESITPVVVFTASTAGSVALGQASATFTSGSLPSGALGVQIRASVLGTAVATGSAGSGNDATIVIGGTAGSVAFGQATVLSESGNGANYVLAMSVLVADANGNPAPAGTVVNLSTWPIAWSTGTVCTVDADTATTGTFVNEDQNENLNLDSVPSVATNEDGYRRRYYTPFTVLAGGTADTLITPPNSAGGLVPAQVTTDSNGVATFNLTYGKSSAMWVVTRIRARTVVQGSEAVSSTEFRLQPLLSDVDPAQAICKLPNSTYRF